MRFLANVIMLVMLCVNGKSLQSEEPAAGMTDAAVRDPALEALLADAETGPAVTDALRCRDDGDDDAALKHLRRANAAVKKKHGANSPQQLPILDLASEILVVAGRFAEAVAPLERAVAIRGPLAAAGNRDDEVTLASSLLLLGKALAETGDADKASAALTRASELFTAALGEEHEATRMARQSLAALVAKREAG